LEAAIEQMLQKDVGARVESLENEIARGARRIDELVKVVDQSRTAEAHIREGGYICKYSGYL
jgi:hypothetical protein